MRGARAFVMLLVVVATLAAVPARAEAVTLKEIIQLTKADVGDDVIVALIDIEQRVFPIDSETLSMLKQAGVSDKVLIAIVKSGRTAPPAPPPNPLAQNPVDDPPPPPPFYVVEREPSATREVVVPVPVYVAVPTRRSGHGGHGSHDGRVRRSTTSYEAINTPRFPSLGLGPVVSTPKPKPAEPVYWGWGGKRRPDTWDEPNPPSKKK
jgi:hypothetical protein